MSIYTVKPLYKKLFFVSTFFLIERFSYKEVFTFPMILRINLQLKMHYIVYLFCILYCLRLYMLIHNGILLDLHYKL